MNKKFTLVYFMGALLCLSVFAEPDNGKFLPDAEPPLVNHVFIEAGGGLNFPMMFFNQGTIAMTSFGGDAFIGAGYNFSGWLTSVTYTHDMWGQGKGEYALMENFHNNIVELRIRKILSKKSIKWFPKMLEMIPGIGLGVNFITTDYYPSVRAKDEGRMNQVNLGDDGANCLFYRAGLEFAINGITDMFIPFIGADYNAFYDTSIGGGFAGFGRVYVGVRSYPLGVINDIKRAREQERYEQMVASWPAPNVTIKAQNKKDFTPDGDGINDVAIFDIRTEYLEADPEYWAVSICDKNNKEIKRFEGKGSVPNQVVWDGESEDGELVFSRNDYSAKLTIVPSEKDRERTGSSELKAEDSLKTGILFQVLVPDKQWKIIVNTIYFDPDRATFDKISEAQRQENFETLESITKQIAEHGEVEVLVEGYANNVSNTERENKLELIPLSRLRAQTIMKLLIENGLEEEMLSYEGNGGKNPIARWEDRENWWKNRRVEFIVTKKES